ncbi:hypothetical protein BN1723_001271, partial [Verticillium longisporum]
MYAPSPTSSAPPSAGVPPPSPALALPSPGTAGPAAGPKPRAVTPSKENFFEDLPMTSRPRPASRQSSRLPSPALGGPASLPQGPPPAQYAPLPSTQSMELPKQEAPPALPRAESSGLTGLVAPPRVSPYAALQSNSPGTSNIPNNSRYSPAPPLAPAVNGTARPGSANRYSPAPPASRPPSATYSAAPPPAAVLPHLPRTSSPLAHFEVSHDRAQSAPVTNGEHGQHSQPDRRISAQFEPRVNRVSSLPPTQEVEEDEGAKAEQSPQPIDAYAPLGAAPASPPLARHTPPPSAHGHNRLAHSKAATNPVKLLHVRHPRMAPLLRKQRSPPVLSTHMPQHLARVATTIFVLDYRNTTTPLPNLLSVSQFLATSLTFVALQHVEFWIDDYKVLSLHKKASPSVEVPIPRDLETRTRDGLMTVHAVDRTSAQIDASFMGVIGWKPRATAAKQSDQYGMGAEVPSLRSFFSRLTSSASQAGLRGKAHKEEAGLFSNLTRRLGFDTPEDDDDDRHNGQLDKPAQDGRQLLPPPPGPGPSTTGSTGGGQKGKDDGRVTSPATVEQNLLNAINSTRSHDSNQLFSPPSMNEVKEQATYCDSTSAKNIAFAAEASNGMKVFTSRDMTLEPGPFLQRYAGPINAFAALLTEVGGVYSLSPKVLHIFYDDKGGTIAFNSSGSIFCNLRFFLQLHADKLTGARQAEAKAEAAVWWWVVMAHELAHNLVQSHDSDHSYYTESFIQQYFAKMVAKTAQWSAKPLPAASALARAPSAASVTSSSSRLAAAPAPPHGVPQQQQQQLPPPPYSETGRQHRYNPFD